MSSVPGRLINGTMYADSLVGSEGDDTINAGMGVDTIHGHGGDDLISIGVGDEFSDVVHGGDGVDSLLVTVQDTQGSYWMPANMYWVGYDAAGTAIGMIAVGSHYNMATADLALSGTTLKLNTGNGYPGAWIDGIENLSLWASQRDDSDDMLLLRGTGTYNGHGGFNGLYADWGGLATPITWDNRADATVQEVGGSSMSNVQRLLLKSGSGDDDIRNTAVATDDEFETGTGNDTVYAGGGRDRIDAGPGDDLVSVVVGSEFADTVHGGEGVDSLLVTVQDTEDSYWMPANMYWVGYDAAGTAIGMIAVGSHYNMATADLALSGTTLKLNTGNGYPGVWIDGIENLSLWASQRDDSDDMLLLRGTGTYNGHGGFNGLYADWSGLATPITWDNRADATVQEVGGSSISNVQRLLLKSASGDDDIRNTAVATDDEFETGAGNDTVYAGGGRDRIDGGPGDDLVSVVVGSEFADTVHGGEGVDSLLVTVQDTPGMYWVGYDAAGNAIGMIAVGSHYNMASADLALSGTTLKLNTSNGYPGVWIDGIENLSVSAAQRDDSDDMLLLRGTGTYNGHGGFNGLYADWSALTTPITWDNRADATVQVVGGSSLSNVQRLLLKSGAGDDDIRNTAVATNDEFETGAGNDRVYAGAGHDRIAGGSGNDTIDGGPGNDALIGGPGVDLAIYSDAPGPVVVNLATGSATGAAGDDSLAEVEQVHGSAHADTLIGDDSANTLRGGPGNDTLDGGAGDDTAVFVGNRADYAISHASAEQRFTLADLTAGRDGTDTVAGVELFQFADGMRTAAELIYELANPPMLLVGTSGDDRLMGGAGHDTLQGLAGNDTLDGGDGNDTLDGGAGIDSMVGGAGNDTFHVDAAGDVTAEAANAGIDWVITSVNRTLNTYTENLRLAGSATSGTGNGGANRIEGNAALSSTLFGGGGDDTLVGGAGNDTLNGATGNDSMAGGTGSDTYIVDSVLDVVEELHGQGIDRVTVNADMDWTLGPNFERLNYAGSFSGNGTGNELPNLLQGNPGHNRLSGLAGNDTLTGGAGNDTLDGGTGADVMVGQEGDDTYYIDASGDQTIESYPTFGIDHAITSINRTISTNVEKLTLAGAAVLGSGNGLANVLTGNELANTLNGVAGDDTLIGNAGNDTLNGGSGNDSMYGGTGDDVYAVDANNDVVVEHVGEGTDRVSSTVSWVLAVNIENLTLAGTASISGTGNDLPNVITGTPGFNAIDGGAGDDTLSGFDGNDTLTGGAGNDRLTGGNGADRFRFVTTGEGMDTITDFASGSDKIAIVAANFGLVAGSTASLVVNGNPTSAAAVFLYTSATGSLAFDGDGTGPVAAVPLALLANKPATLLPADIVVGP